jgi:hypothetical protein
MSLTSYRAAPPRDVGEGDWGGSAGPGGDLLFHALRRSTIGAEGFHGRVRDGIGCLAPRYGHQAVQALPVRRQGSGSEGSELALPLLSERSELCACLLLRGLPPRLSAQLALRLSPRRNLAVPPAMMLAAGCGRSKRYRAISTGQLRGLPRFHLRPIDVVVYHGSRRDLVLRRVSRLDAFSGYPVRT